MTETSTSRAAASRAPIDGRTDVVVVGAGFAGLYMHHKLRELGLSAIGFEAGDGVGGTWYWNRYPGARCDVESMQYCYSFSDEVTEEWNWSERYASQPEILRYIEFVAGKYDLTRDIRFETRVVSATYDDAQREWLVVTDRGDRVRARFCIMATGNLSSSRIPDMPGLADFGGPVLHTGRWPQAGMDFTGKRVAIIGNGSSGIQAIPRIAAQADKLFVLQRSPSFSVPARNRKLNEAEIADWKSRHREIRAEMRRVRSGALLEFNDKSAVAVSDAEREGEYQRRWSNGGASFLYAFNDIMRSEEANATAADFVRGKIAETVRDPRLAAKLQPTGVPLGAKRICVDTDYFETFNRSNVELVDLKERPIEAFEASGIRLADGLLDVDVVVFATGYDAMTGALLVMDIRGRNGASLRDKWRDGPRSYLGLVSSGFPNLFTVTGPGSPSVLGNVVVSIEQHVEWIAACLSDMQARGATVIDSDLPAEDRWVDHVRELAAPTLYMKAASWYMGANVPGKPRVFMPYIGGIGPYREACDRVVAAGYEGFVFEGEAGEQLPRAAE